jgi:hypothetical protein
MQEQPPVCNKCHTSGVRPVLSEVDVETPAGIVTLGRHLAIPDRARSQDRLRGTGPREGYGGRTREALVLALSSVLPFRSHRGKRDGFIIDRGLKPCR